MRLLRTILIPSTFALVSFCFTCQTVSPVMPLRLSSPSLHSIELTVIKTGADYTESAHLFWTKPLSDSVQIAFYNLLRLFPGDSAYNDNFPSSQGIPADSVNFYDPVHTVFPSGYQSYLPLVYRIYAVDEFGRSGDTSAPCTLLVVKQPVLKSTSFSTGCLTWYSDVNLTGPYSYCRIWNDSSGLSWTSNTFYTFPPTDKPAEFTACLPDSLLIFYHGAWNYALYMDVGGSKSLKTGLLNVP